MTIHSKSLVQASAEEREDLADAFTPALREPHDPERPPGTLPEPVQALLAGRSTVRRCDTRRGPVHTVVGPVRPEEGPDEPVLGRFEDRAVARVVASVLPAGAEKNPFLVGDHERRRGHPVFHDGLLLGHVSHPDGELAARLHLAYTYAANLESLAHLLEGLDARALVFLGRVLERRLEAAKGDKSPRSGPVGG